jgi:C-terminal peptidase prc
MTGLLFWLLPLLLSQTDPEGADAFAERMVARSAAIVDHHVDPPSLRALVFLGAREVAREAALPEKLWTSWLPEKLDRQSARRFLHQLFLAAREQDLSVADIQRKMMDGITSQVPGRVHFLDGPAALVHSQLSANRYVGVGVHLQDREGRPQVTKMFFDGPAHRAGIEVGDVVYEIDGRDTLNMGMGPFIEYARGAAETEVSYLVGGEDRSQLREARMIRREVPQETVTGVERDDAGRWRHRLAQAPLAYVRIDSLAASTPMELRKAALVAEREAVRGVILDLRSCGGDQAHSAVLVADTLLAAGPIGALRVREGIRPLSSGPDALFVDLPMAVLIGPDTWGAAEWLAACLSRRRNALLVGNETAGKAELRKVVEVAGQQLHLNLRSGWFLWPAAPLDEARPFVLSSLFPDHLASDKGDQAQRVAIRELLGVRPL